jgi:hypothetical protein
MTSIEFLFNELWETSKDKFEWHSILEKAKEMHKQEIIDAYKVGNNDYANFNYVATSGENYYQKTFVSKGSETFKVWECCGMEECICKGNDVEKLAIDKIIEMLESQIVLSAYNKLGGTQRTGDYRIGLRKAIDICSEVKDELPKSKSTLYTEEQVREAYWIGVNRGNGVNVMSLDNFIQSLKQPKKD